MVVPEISRYYVLCRIQYFGPKLFALTVSGIQTLLENPPSSIGTTRNESPLPGEIL